MFNLTEWLKKEAKGTEVPLIIFSAIIVITLYTNALWGVPRSPLRYHDIGSIIAIFVIISIVEETLFRLLPMYLAVRFLKTPTGIFGAAIVSSVIFGVIHSGLNGIIDQGVGGLLICLVFLKCGGFQKRYWKALAATSALHIGLNLTFLGEIIFIN